MPDHTEPPDNTRWVDLAEAERLVRADHEDCERDCSEAVVLAEYDRRGAALAERDAENERLRAAVVEHLTFFTSLPDLADAPTSRLIVELRAFATAAAPADECSIPCDADCDADCDAPCHEVHAVNWKRGHEPDACAVSISSADPAPSDLLAGLLDSLRPPAQDRDDDTAGEP